MQAISQVKSAGGRRVKVAMVSHYMPPHIGGVELVAESLFRAYADSGMDARWISSRAPRDAAAREGSRIRVSCWNFFEERLDVPVPLWGIEGIREMSRLVSWADVVHAHDCLYPTSALATLLARRAGKPLLLSQHIGFAVYSSRLLNAVESAAYNTLGRAVLTAATRVVFCTPGARDFARGLLKREIEGSTMILNGIDAGRFRPADTFERASIRRELGLNESDCVVLFVGRLVEKKGIHIVLEASRLMPSTRFLIVGDGPLAKSLPLDSPGIVWKPFLPPSQMERIYKAADAFLLPSRSEGFPLSVQESLAAGVPVVVSRGESFAEMLAAGGACVTVERDPAKIASALEGLLRDEAMAERLSAAGRAMALREWSTEAMARRYCEIIEDLARQSRSGSF